MYMGLAEAPGHRLTESNGFWSERRGHTDGGDASACVSDHFVLSLDEGQLYIQLED